MQALSGAAGFYTQTNSPENAVVAFPREADGTIVHRETVKTGGKGLAAVPPLGFPTLDRSGSVHLTSDGRLLFVVNAGDNTISSIRVTRSGLELADRVASGGILPVSVTSSGHLLYVLNELSGSIYGLRFSNSGRLTPIVTSLQALSTVGPSGASAQISRRKATCWSSPTAIWARSTRSASATTVRRSRRSCIPPARHNRSGFAVAVQASRRIELWTASRRAFSRGSSNM